MINDTQCGSTSFETSTESSIYECIKKCDNDANCDKCSFKDANGECKLFSDTGNSNVASTGVVCVEKEFHSPDRNYHDDDTEEHTDDTQCSDGGDQVLDGYGLSVLEPTNFTFHQCVSFCNAFVDCTGFEITDDTDCKLYTGVNITIANYTGSGTKKCYIKESELYGSFVGHTDFECGNELLSTHVGTSGYGETKCYDICSIDPLCGGFEYIESSDSCFVYGQISLFAVSGRTCYKRSDGLNNVIGKHTVRLIFTEAVWNGTLYNDAEFISYLSEKIDNVLNLGTLFSFEVAEADSGGLVVDFLIDDVHATPLGREHIYHILGQTQANDDPYNLGTQLIGDFSLPPPTTAPTSSPSASPTASPTTAEPTASPTRAPTAAASEIVHFFEIVEDHVCGSESDVYKNASAVNVLQCMSECDNDNVCIQATYDESTGDCHMFSSGNILHTAENGKHCLVQKYAGPQHSYSSYGGTNCAGGELLSDAFTDKELKSADWSDCAYVCNNWLECEGFNFVEASSKCTFITSQDSQTTVSGTQCNIKDFLMTGTYAGHANMGCGVDVRGQTTNVEYGIHSCIKDCDDDSLCVAWEYYPTPKTCVRYASLDLYLSTGKTCYSRAFVTDTFLDKHLGRIRFVDATWNATLHESEEFKTYIEGVLEHILQKNVTVLFVIEGSVVVEYVVEEETMSALSGQQLALIKDKIVNDGIHDLGVNLIGGSDPPPPTATPTSSPTTGSPTAAPTDSPTPAPTSPTPAPTAVPTTASPTTPPTSVINGIFEGHQTVEVVVFVLIGVSAAIFLYVAVKFLFIWSKGGNGVVNYDEFP